MSSIYVLGVRFQAFLGEAPRWFSETHGELRTLSGNAPTDRAGLTLVRYCKSNVAAPFSCACWAKPKLSGLPPSSG